MVTAPGNSAADQHSYAGDHADTINPDFLYASQAGNAQGAHKDSGPLQVGRAGKYLAR
jgi:hypothetical protein